MADSYDGSLVFNTELDNEGFEKGSGKLLSAVDSLTKQVNNLGSEMKNAFSGITSILQTMAAASDDAANGASSGAQQATQAANSAQEAVQAQAQAAQQTAQAQSQQARATQETAAATRTYGKELDRLQKQINTARDNLSGYYQELAEIGRSTDEMMQDVADTPAAESQIDNILGIEKIQVDELNAKYKKKLDILHQLEAQYQKVAAASAAAASSATAQPVTEPGTPVDENQTAVSSVQALEEKLAALREQITAVQASLDAYRQKVAMIKQATDDALKGVVDGPDAESHIDELLKNEKQQLDVLNQEYLENLKILGQLRAEHSRVASALVDEKQTQSQAHGLSGAIGALSQAFRENVTDEKSVEAAAKRVVSVFGEVGSSVKKAAKNLLQLPFKLIASGTKNAISGLKSFAQQTKKTGLSTNGLVKSLTSLKRLLLTRIKRMFISSIFNNVQEGLKQLAKFDSGFNETMSNIQNTATQISGNISATVANIISALEPIITTVLNLLNKAITSVNQFFAVLNGKNTYTAAKQGTESYAEATEAAAAAQKELNAELYGFDELNRQSKKENTSSNDAKGTGIQYEELPINLSDEALDWIERLKEAWKNGDWEGVGQTVAEGLNAGMQVVDDWFNTTLRPLGVAWAGNVAEILNGMVDGVDWPLLGKTVADGLNAITDIANTFLTTFKALNLGRGIGSTIKIWFDNIDWKLVGQTFANGWNTLWHIIEGAVTTPGVWTSIGQSIGIFVKSWFTTLDINSLANILISIINGVAATVGAFLEQDPFAGMSEKLYSAVNRVLHEVDWATLGRNLSNLFLSALQMIVTVVSEIDWNQVGYAVGQALSSINWSEVFANIGKLIWSALTAMFEFLGGMIKGDGLGFLVAGFGLLATNLAAKLAGALFKKPLQDALTTVIADLLKSVIGGSGIGGWGASILAAGKTLLTTIVGKIGTIATTVLPAFLTSLGNIVSGIVAAIGGWPVVIIAAAAAAITALVIWIKNGGAEVIQGFIDGVKEKWEAVKQTLKDFADMWITGFKKLFGIHSPSKVMSEQGGYVMDGLLQGISDKWPKITKFLSEGVSSLTETLSNGWKKMTANAEEEWGALKTDVTTAFDSAKNSVATTASDMRSSLSSTFSGIVSNAQTTWNNLQTTTLNKFSTLKQNVLTAWQNLRTNLNNVQWDNVGHNLVVGLNNGVAGAWGGFMTNVSNMVNNLIRQIKSLFGIHSPSKVFAEIGEFLDAGLVQGMEDGERGLLTTAKNIAAAVTEGMTPDTPNVQMNVDSVVGSMQAIISSLGSLAVTFQTIANALNSIGGFTLPNIAAGTVVPYRTKVAANAAPAGSEDGVEARLLDILSELQALSRSMRNGDGSQAQDIRIFVGEHELFQIFVDEHNRTVRRTGKSPLKV